MLAVFSGKAWNGKGWGVDDDEDTVIGGKGDETIAGWVLKVVNSIVSWK
jgi:glutamine cyclotransferase